MSTDGTQPPSIAPKKSPSRPNRPSTGAKSGQARTTDTGARATRPVTAPLSGSTPPSVGERIKRTAASVAETTRPASSAAVDDLEDTRARPNGAASTATASTATATPVSPARDESPVREVKARESTSAMPTTSPTGSGGPRKVRLAVSKIDPWSVMKLSFLLSVAVGIMIVVASAVVWYTLDDLAVFTSLNDTIREITGKADFFNVLEFASFKRVISLATMVAVVDVVILTALATIGAFLYNIVSALVGGITVTLTDD